MPKIISSDVLNRRSRKIKILHSKCTSRGKCDSSDNLRDLLESLEVLAMEYVPIIVSTHPRTLQRINDLGIKLDNPLIRFSNHLAFLIILNYK